MAGKSGVKILADENISPVLVKIIVLLGGGFVESIHRKPEQGHPDEEWIPVYASRGYVMLSCDRRQTKSEAVSRVMAACGARMVYLPSAFADLRRWDQALWILRHWPKIVARAARMRPGELVLFGTRGASRRT